MGGPEPVGPPRRQRSAAGPDPHLPPEKSSPPGAVNMMLGFVLFAIVGIAVLGFVLLQRGQEESEPPPKPVSAQQRLSMVKLALAEGKLFDASKRIEELERAVPESSAPARLSALVEALRNPGSDTAAAYKAIRWLGSCKNTDLRQCGKLGRELLDAQARKQLEKADALYKERKLEEALVAYRKVPVSSAHATRARRQIGEILDEQANDVLDRAQKALQAGKPLEADKLIKKGEGQIKAKRLAQLNALKAEVVPALEAAAQKSYAAGEGKKALTYLHTRRYTPRYLPLYRKITRVIDLVEQARKLTEQGFKRKAEAKWKAVLVEEADPENPYHQQALAGLQALQKKQK